MRPCYAFTAAKADGEPETLAIYDEIGLWGVQAKDFRTSLANVKSAVINVEINSPGGDVFAGLSIYNMLRASGKEIVVKVMGVAASAASLIAMAGDKIQMPKNTMMMIHNPWSFAMGNADELRDTADTLDKIGASLLGTYVAKTGMAEAEMKALLAKDTWLTADEALEMGFATEITDEIKVSAKFDLERAELPANVLAALGMAPKAVDKVVDPVIEDTTDEPLAEQIGALATKAGLAAHTPIFVLSCATLADAQTRIASAREISAVCAAVKKPDAAAAFITANKTVVEARATLATAMAEEDENSVVDTAPQSKQTVKSGAPKTVNTQSIWAAHNAQNMKKGS